MTFLGNSVVSVLVLSTCPTKLFWHTLQRQVRTQTGNGKAFLLHLFCILGFVSPVLGKSLLVLDGKVLCSVLVTYITQQSGKSTVMALHTAGF